MWLVSWGPVCIKFYAQALFPQRRCQHRAEARPFPGDRLQAIHQTLEDALLGVMIAVADANFASVTPDFGRQKEKP